MHISTVTIPQSVIVVSASITLTNKYEDVYIAMAIPWLILKVTIMYIWIANISKMVTDGANITVVIKYVACRRSISMCSVDFDLL